MNVGMLWFDNNPQTNLEQKIVDAASYYRDKYGQVPNYCEINPANLPPMPLERMGVIEVRTSRTILIHHIWIGVNGQTQSNISKSEPENIQAPERTES